MKQKASRAWLAAFFFLLLMAGCGQQPAQDTTPKATALSVGPEEPPVDGGRMVWALLAEPGHLLWPFSTDQASHLVGQHFLDASLLEYNAELEIVPSAASSFEVLDEGRRLIFHLRKGILWEDGRELTSKDVAFTYELMIDNATPTAYADDFKAVESLTAPDPYTVEVRYKEPFARSLITWMSGILPSHKLQGVTGQALLQSPLGQRPLAAGPYRLAERHAGSRLVLEARDNWFGGRPRLDQVVIRAIPDQGTQFMELGADRLDRMELVPRQYLFQFKGDELASRYNVFPHLAFSYTYVGWNLRHPLFADRRVRTALAHSVDKEELIKGVLLGQGRPTIGPYKPGTWVYNEDIEDYAYNPKRAGELLAQAGWTDSDGDGVLDKDGRRFEFTLLTNQGNDLRIKAATILQRRFADLGVEMRIRTVEWAAFLREFVNPGRFEAVMLGWNILHDPDIFNVWHSSMAEPGGLNFVGYRNKRVDVLLERGQRTLDTAERKAIYDEVQRILHRDQPYCFLFTPMALPLVAGRIQGVVQAPGGIDHNLSQWWIPKRLQRFRLEP